MSIILLAGLIFGGPGYILCIGDDGQIQFETIILPSHIEAAETCHDDFPNDFHHEHDDCSSCSDLELEGPLCSGRLITSRIDGNSLFAPVSKIASGIFVESGDETFSTLARVSLIHEQPLPAAMIAAAILLC